MKMSGGPGAGKTHWNLVVSAFAQAKRVVVRNEKGERIGSRGVKILYVLDINKPLDDICTKFLKTYRDLGYHQNIVRVGRWKLTGPKNHANFTVRDWLNMAKLKRRVSLSYRKPDVAPSLDEGKMHSPQSALNRAI
jgi:hypothetical protein